MGRWFLFSFFLLGALTHNFHEHPLSLKSQFSFYILDFTAEIQLLANELYIFQ
jgi:hypothetical protein